METLIGQAPMGGPAGQGPGASDLIKDSGLATFREDVLDASRQVPVIVDFWAPWCGPCRQLGPALEKAVMAAGGAVRMVKIDVDQNPEIAGQMRIQSIPAVYAFFQGQPVDGFQGALPDSQVKAFVDRLVKMSGGVTPIDEVMEFARTALAEGRLDDAEAAFAEVLQAEEQHAGALAGLAKIAVARGALEDADEFLAAVPEEKENDAEVAGARAALALAREAAEVGGDLAPLQAAVDADPTDHQARFDLAVGLHAAGRVDAAVDQLLEIVKRDRKWNDEAARKQLVKLFDALGFDDPIAMDGRRRLSSILFA